MMNKNLNERLSWLDSNLVVESDSELVVRETGKDGEATISCKLTHKSILFIGLEKKKCQYYSHSNCADAVIFEKLDNNEWRLHVVECKRTVKTGAWIRIKDQFKGAILNANALIGLLGIDDITDIRCYTAFRFNKLTVEQTEDPVLLKPLVGRALDMVTYYDWDRDKLYFDILPGATIVHRKILLDENTGYGEVVI